MAVQKALQTKGLSSLDSLQTGQTSSILTVQPRQKVWPLVHKTAGLKISSGWKKDANSVNVWKCVSLDPNLWQST